MTMDKHNRDNRFNILRNKVVETRKKACRDFSRFRDYYFEDEHKYPDSDFHEGLSCLLQKKSLERGAKIAIAAPRDSAKSTIVSLEYVIYCICYKIEDFIVITSSTSDQAVDFLSHVKDELELNEKLQRDFPEVCEIGEKPKPPRWTRKEIITRNGVKVIALGTGQQIRGRRNRSERPSLIILDDIETGETSQSPENFQKLEDWLTKSVLKAGTNRTNIVYVGTIHHYNSLLAKFTSENDYPGWEKHVFRSVISWAERTDLWQKWTAIFCRKETFQDLEGPKAALEYFQGNKDLMLVGTEVLWPDKLSFYDLMVMREVEGHYSFDSEMQNEPINPRDCCFPLDIVHFWDDEYDSEEGLLKVLRNRGNFSIIGACDPSMGKDNIRGDRSAIITAVKDHTDETIYILDADMVKRYPDDMIGDILNYHRSREYHIFGFEAIQAQDYMADQLEARAMDEGLPLVVEKVIPTVNKIVRIQNLHPLIKHGRIKFSRRHYDLLEELKYFPKGRYDDGLDALEMVYQISNGITGGGTVGAVGVQVSGPKGPSSYMLRGVPDQREEILKGGIPGVYRRRDEGDRFVPPEDEKPRFIIF